MREGARNPKKNRMHDNPVILIERWTKSHLALCKKSVPSAILPNTGSLLGTIIIHNTILLPATRSFPGEQTHDQPQDSSSLQAQWHEELDWTELFVQVLLIIP